MQISTTRRTLLRSSPLNLIITRGYPQSFIQLFHPSEMLILSSLLAVQPPSYNFSVDRMRTFFGAGCFPPQASPRFRARTVILYYSLGRYYILRTGCKIYAQQRSTANNLILAALLWQLCNASWIQLVDLSPAMTS